MAWDTVYATPRGGGRKCVRRMRRAHTFAQASAEILLGSRNHALSATCSLLCTCVVAAQQTTPQRLQPCVRAAVLMFARSARQEVFALPLPSSFWRRGHR